MTRAHVWQTFSWLHWLLHAASPWRETAVGKPSSRSDQLSVQDEEVWSPQRQQPFPGGSLFSTVEWRAGIIWLYWLQGSYFWAAPSQPTADLGNVRIL